MNRRLNVVCLWVFIFFQGVRNRACLVEWEVVKISAVYCITRTYLN